MSSHVASLCFFAVVSLGIMTEPSLALARQPSSEPTPPDAIGDDAEHPFFGGANGPGAGKAQVLVGGGGLVVTGGRAAVGGPGISLGVNYGIAEAADFRFRADTSAVFAGRSGGPLDTWIRASSYA